MKKLTLVVLAAGMGSRYGGLKQMDTFTSQGDTIIDFSIYDALQAGFQKFVFVIRKSIEKDFRATIDNKLKNKAEVEYVFQEVNNVPEKYKNSKREKPWGTGHAVLMTKNVVNENFAIINADDFYGRDAFNDIAKQLIKTKENSFEFCMIGYALKNTISENGYVSRGECFVNKEGYLTNVIERTRIETIDGYLKFEDEKGKMVSIDKETTVSMNIWGFTTNYFEYGEKLFLDFLEKNKENLKAEFYLPFIVNSLLASKKASVKVLKSKAKWFGVTYNDDKENVEKEIKKLKEAGVYPINLWN
ncbi:nucleotidyltransferase family protein [Polaribacter marinivivus]|uniref:UTP--glucose-1-phosphate uridylyltransferase n=1 Tax=Polaribacter marinivivus TaxID=1524260 RepID=A0ABV8R8S6_9FLAO